MGHMTRPSDGDLRTDTVLRNTYKIASVLGRGGMGSVYLAQHLRLPGKQVAVKVLRGGDHLTQEIFTRFRREAEIASRLGHPNIVEVLDYDTLEDGTPFLVLEFLRGENLQSRLERGRLPLDEVFSYTRQMGSALQAAHGAGIIHRDLKPANVFLVPTDSGGVVGQRVKLLDFGISKVLSSETLQTQEATILGTPQYMSPEQAMGKNREIDARTDIFALGAMVYEMMSGKPVFGAGSLAQLIFRVVYEPADPLAPLCPEAPAHALAAVERALSKNPADRFPDVASFVEALTGSPLHTLSPPVGAHPVPRAAPKVPSGIALPSQNPAEGFDATIAPSLATPASSGPSTGHRGPVQPEPERPPQPLTAAPPPPGPAPQPSPPSVAGGAVPPVTPPASRSRGLRAAAAAVALFAAGGGGVWWMSRPEPSAPTPQTQATATPPAATGNDTPGVTAQPPPGTEPTAAQLPPTVQAVTTADAPSPQPVAATPQVIPGIPRPTARPEPKENLPEEVRQLLDEAESALKAGNTEEAIRLAKRSQRTKSDVRPVASYSILTRAYCLRKDLGAAKGEWPKVSASEKPRIRQLCKQYDIEF